MSENIEDNSIVGIVALALATDRAVVVPIHIVKPEYPINKTHGPIVWISKSILNYVLRWVFFSHENKNEKDLTAGS